MEPRVRVDHARHAADDEGVAAVEEIADHLGGIRPLGCDRVDGEKLGEALPFLGRSLFVFSGMQVQPSLFASGE